MNGRWAELFGRARQLESAIQARIERRHHAQATAPARQPLELIHALVRRVEQEVQPAGRGRVVFPFGQIKVWIAVASPHERARFAAVCEGPPSLEDRIHECLAAAHCEATPLQVKTTFVPRAPHGRESWIDPDFHVEYARTAPAVETAPPGRIELTVLQGTAEKSTYSFIGGAGSVTLGRGTDVRDDRGQLIRTNQVAFLEGTADINDSVSRRHARIEHESARDAFRLHDDGASHGTSVIRDGHGVPVPRARGLRLRSDDIIVLGQARVRVRLHDGK